MISRAEIEKLADLSRLKLSDEEITKMQGEMSAILAYVDKLKKVTDKEFAGENGSVMSVNKNVMREDTDPHESGVYTDKLIKSAPRSEGGFVKVKKIL
ncbi:MAG: Asp-tRNA(Asn)/Glu-tRNA(Gln) amidotransferase subunit GatC [Patescibacteria group bacterium]